MLGVADEEEHEGEAIDTDSDSSLGEPLPVNLGVCGALHGAQSLHCVFHLLEMAQRDCAATALYTNEGLQQRLLWLSVGRLSSRHREQQFSASAAP